MHMQERHVFGHRMLDQGEPATHSQLHQQGAFPVRARTTPRASRDDGQLLAMAKDVHDPATLKQVGGLEGRGWSGAAVDSRAAATLTGEAT